MERSLVIERESSASASIVSFHPKILGRNKNFELILAGGDSNFKVPGEEKFWGGKRK